jgi:hypothetical protein
MRFLSASDIIGKDFQGQSGMYCAEKPVQRSLQGERRREGEHMSLHDADIREPLFEYLEEKYGKVRIIEEKQMGRSRADVVMVLPDAVAGIEIKSDADSYVRLGRQVKDYDRYFDYNWLVVGSTHAMSSREHVPGWWGIISVEQMDPERAALDFYIIREAEKNPGADVKRKLKFLWRQELMHIQKLNGMYKYSSKSKDFVIRKMAEAVPEEILHRQISDELFERDYNIYS